MFYLVRHAHAVWQPDEQQRLSPRGRAAAERVAEVLLSRPLAAIYASPYPRAIQTVEPLARRLGLLVEVEPGLRERQLSIGPVPDFEKAVRWAWEHPYEALPGGETNREALRRGLAVIAWVRAFHPNGHVALSTHGSLMAILLHHFDPSFRFEEWERMTMPDLYRLSAGGEVARMWEGS